MSIMDKSCEIYEKWEKMDTNSIGGKLILYVLFGLDMILAACIEIFIGDGRYRDAIVSAVIFLIPLIWIFLTGRRVRRKRKMAAFYSECILNGITDLECERNMQKAMLIAQKHIGLNVEKKDMLKIFREAKEAAEKKKTEAEESKLNEQKTKETASKAALTRYALYHGRNKRIAMLTDEMQEAKNSAKMMDELGTSILRASIQKESDASILGGIADGIAGPAAGLTTAIDTHQKNARIRAQNEANFRANAPIANASYSASGRYESTASLLQSEINATKTKLVSEDSPASCLDKIAFTGTKVSVSETGTCTVTTSAGLKEPMRIFDTVDAVVDGTVIAEIYDGANIIGSATLVLPKYGIGTDPVNLRGMCLFCGKQGKNYTVKYRTDNLWAMER